LEHVSLTELLRELLDGMTPQLERRQIRLNTELEEVEVKGERFLLEQAMANLLQNAIDFTPPDHAITVSLRRTEDRVNFRVHNTGSEIPDFAAGRLFERFYSLARPDTGRRSSGIGLTLVKGIMELHAGSVSLHNEDQGVTATLILPV
jgi:two-component system sensor histidine kinase CreC